MRERPAAAEQTARPAGRPFLLRLPPWSRAVLLGLRSPAAVVAVLVTTAILACAVASAPLFLSSARSAALQGQLAPQCAEAGWPTAEMEMQFAPGPGAQKVSAYADTLRQGWARQGIPSGRVLELLSGVGAGGNLQGALLVHGPTGDLSQPARVLWRPGITDHVHAVEAPHGSGVWLPASYAQAAGVHVGGQITMVGVPVTVAGVYTDLFATDPGAYWCDYKDLFLNLSSADIPPPALVLATDQATVYRLASGAGALRVLEQVPVERSTLTVTAARNRLAELDRAVGYNGSGTPLPGPALDARLGPPAQRWSDPRLADAVTRASRIERGLQGPVIPVAVAGGLLALVLVGSAGSFWADRRASEVRLLAARGVGPGWLAVKAALELALPALAGAALGWAVSRLLIGALGPANDLDPSATSAALWTGVGAFVVGLGCAAAVAGLRARGTAERPLGAAPRWPARVPWELALLLAAAGCWLLLESRQAIVIDHGVAQVNGLLVAFPLLGIAGTAVLLTRVLVRLLPAVRRWAGRRSSAVFLAMNRLAAAPLAAGTLLVAVALPVAVLGYTATLTSSSETTLHAKAAAQIGAERALISVDPIRRTPGTAAVGTVVDRYEASVDTPDGASLDAEVLAVDPRTFPRTAFWDGSFADQSLDELMADLSRPVSGGRVPVVAMGVPAGDLDLHVGTQAVPADVVATARVLPGRRLNGPLILASIDRLPRIEAAAYAGRTSELWTNAPQAAATKALVATGARSGRVLDPGTVFSTANFLGITWTFGYLSALAVFVGVIAVGGLLLYLEARSRTRVSGYVMARRLGLSRGAHLRSLVVELAGVAVVGLVVGAILAGAAVAVVYRRLDVDLVRPPTPLLDIPWLAAALTAVAALAVAALAALYAQRAADRANPATVLREDA